MAQPAVFKAVPFDEAWIASDKIDVHAIYRRPILDDLGEQAVDKNGVPQWDLTGGLPVRRHYDWRRKGFEYVTLADGESLAKVAPLLRKQGLNASDFIMLRNRVVGATPWNPALYLASQQSVDRAQFDQLRTLVERLGSDVVLEVQRASNPGFQLPAHLRDIPPGGKAKAPAGRVLDPGAPSAVTPGETTGPLGPGVRPIVPKVAKKSQAARERKAAQKREARAAAAATAAPRVEEPAV